MSTKMEKDTDSQINEAKNIRKSNSFIFII